VHKIDRALCSRARDKVEGLSQAPRLQAERVLERRPHCKGSNWQVRIGFCNAKIFSLETFFDFSNFSGNRKEVLEAIMMNELFVAAALLSILFALAAHWQNGNDGGLI
jgi:hypothetical protein